MLALDIDIIRAMGSANLEKEWAYFQEWARRFPKYPKAKRYGILPMGASLSEDNMIYDPDIKELRKKHILYVLKEGGDVGMKLRKHIDWIEKLEGKQ